MWYIYSDISNKIKVFIYRNRYVNFLLLCHVHDIAKNHKFQTYATSICTGNSPDLIQKLKLFVNSCIYYFIILKDIVLMGARLLKLLKQKILSDIVTK